MNRKLGLAFIIVGLTMILIASFGPATAAQDLSLHSSELTPGIAPTHTAMTLAPGKSETKTFTVTTGENPIDKGDVMFVFDLTGSMDDELSQAQSAASQIMTDIVTEMPNTWFGVASFLDYPGYYSYPGYADSYGDESDVPWVLNSHPTADIPAASTHINALGLGGGSDGPESYSRMLYELANAVQWRSNSKKIAVVFGDAPTHDLDFDNTNNGGDPGRDGVAGTADDLDFETVVGNLRDKGISILAVNSGLESWYGEATFRGMSEGYDTASGTNGQYFQLDNTADLPEATVALILAETAVVDRITLEVTEGFKNWIAITPTEHQNVTPNSTVNFSVKFTPPEGTAPGFYPFVIRAVGDGTIMGLSYVEIIVPGRDPVTDNGFRPSQDGFKFINDGAVPGATWGMFSQYFGKAAVEYSNGDHIYAATKYYESEYRQGDALGDCDGFTTTSHLNFFNLSQLNAGNFAMSRADSLFYASRTKDMEEAISFNQAVQGGLEVNKHNAYLQDRVGRSPKALYAYLREAIANGEPMIAHIFWGKSCAPFPFQSNCIDGGGHSLLPYKIEEDGDDKAYVYVYDPNQPGRDDRRIIFDLKKNTWTFHWPVSLSLDIPLTGTGATDDPEWISFVPLEMYRHRGLAPWLSSLEMEKDTIPQPQFRAFQASGVIRMLFIDDEGRRLGFEGDALYNEIPGATYQPDSFGEAAEPGGTFLIPEEANVTISFSAAEAGKGDLLVFGAGYMIALSLSDADAGTTAIMDIGQDEERIGVIVQTGALTGDLTANKLLAGEDRTVSLVGALLGAGESLSVNLTVAEEADAEDQIAISGVIQEPKQFGLSLHRAGGAGYSVFGSTQLSVDQNFNAWVRLPDWTSIAKVDLDIDWGQDGETDELVSLTNEAVPTEIRIEAETTTVRQLRTPVALDVAVLDQFGAYVKNGTVVTLSSNFGSLVPNSQGTSGGFVHAVITPDEYGLLTITVIAGDAEATLTIEVEPYQQQIPMIVR
ncbi:MAG: VWA domain-containing protein [Candidatus Promineofilum sp.]|nr:VWA domain-containing protein [Promineifilum sp.]